MYPFLHVFGFPIGTFGLMLWLAAVAAAFLLDRAFHGKKIDADAVGIVAVAVLAGVVGAKIWHVIDTPIEFRELGWSVLWDRDGFAWFGGMVFGIAALLIQGVRAKIGALRMLDLAAPAAAVGYAIGRLGCLLSGDGCYGLPTHLPWGMAFPHGVIPIDIPVHPTPLYECLVGLLIGAWLWRQLARTQAVGAVLGQYLALTGVARFLVEFLRRNPKVLWGLSNAQLASVGSVIAGVILLVWAARKAGAVPQTITE